MTKRLQTTLAALAALATATLALAACGGDDTATSSQASASSSTTAATAAGAGGGGTIQIEADPSGQLAFTETQLSAQAGSDTVELVNDSATAHNVEIEDANGNEVAATDTISGDTTETSADLEPGTYTFYCSVDGHRDAGMEGTITVK